VQKLLRQTDQVIFSFDGDAAGRRAARRALEACLPHASDNRTLKFLFLPSEHDPDSYIREHGYEGFEKLVLDAVPLSQFLIAEVIEGKDLSTAEGRARAQFDAKPLIQAMPVSGLRLQLVRQLAQVTDSSVQEIEALFELSKPATGGYQRAPKPAVKRRPPVELERQVLRLLLAHPALASGISAADLSLIGRSAPDGGAMLETVAAAARSLPPDASLAVLAEALRSQGADLDGLIAEIAAEPAHDPELAQRELAGAVRQTRMKSLKAEQEQLAAAGLAGEAERSRYRAISVELDQLRVAADNDARS